MRDVACRITVPLLSTTNVRDAARVFEWLARELRAVHAGKGGALKQISAARHRIHRAHRRMISNAVGIEAIQKFHGAT